MKLKTCYEWSFGILTQLSVSVSMVIVFRGAAFYPGQFKFRAFNLEFPCMHWWF